jgi:hypothetical protein
MRVPSPAARTMARRGMTVGLDFTMIAVSGFLLHFGLKTNAAGEREYGTKR